MTGIFSYLDKTEARSEGGWDEKKCWLAIQKYIYTNLDAVYPYKDRTTDKAVDYLTYCIYDVYRRERYQNPSLRSVLALMEEDLIYSKEKYGDQIGFLLEFLETDTRKKALSNISIRRESTPEEKLLGRIIMIRRQYFPEEEAGNRPSSVDTDVEKPTELKQYLDRYVIGQEDAKKAICLAVYGHGKRLRHPKLSFAPNVVLLIGPSGCGKTEIMRKIRDITKYPMVFTDVSSLGASQFRGRHKEDLLIELWMAAGKNQERAEQGIIFMDEFDKVLIPAISERGVNVHDDVQSQLLTMLEGSEVELKVDGQPMLMDTSKILFVLAGAFQGIEEYIRSDQKKRMTIPGNIGFSATLETEMNLEYIRENINHEVLMDYGMKRELAGRISSIVVLERLKKEDLVSILTEPEDSLIERYTREMKHASEADLVFTDGALEAVAEEAIKTPVGARALHSILSKVMQPVLYEAPGIDHLQRVLITEETIREGTKPTYERYL